jgi:hypothetical protein
VALPVEALLFRVERREEQLEEEEEEEEEERREDRQWKRRRNIESPSASTGNAMSNI